MRNIKNNWFTLSINGKRHYITELKLNYDLILDTLEQSLNQIDDKLANW